MSYESNFRSAHSTLYIRWLLFNSLVAVLYVVGVTTDAIDMFIYDPTYMTNGIIIVGVGFQLLTGKLARDISRDWSNLNIYQRTFTEKKLNGLADEFKVEFAEYLLGRLSLIKIAGPILVGLGILGTVIGIIIAFSDISPDIIADVDASTAGLTTLLSGLTTAFTTTLAGLVAMLINLVNLHMLTRETNQLYAATISGE